MAADAPSLDTIFCAAVAIPSAAERAAYIAGACGADAELRGRVDKLVAAHFQAGSFLEKPVQAPVATAALAAPAVEAVLADTLAERPGTMIGPYKLLEQIGEGGFGVVFMAEQHEPVRRKVALKILKPGMDTRQVVARFEAERQALALMDHPNIARVLDGGQTSSGRPYFVMDLVKGRPLTEYCDQAQLTPRERLELFAHLCQAVQHAHQKGIIHRDLKPSNVLVAVHDTTPVVKVIDFGVAKALGQELTDKTLFTGFAQMVGTPLYMSPEQAGQSGLDIDTRSDIYSLGVLLYELLTGTTPFDKNRLKEVGYDELRRIIREEEPPRPSTRISTLGVAATTVSTNRKSDPKRLSQLLRGELDWIVMKALEKDRNRRYETASALAADVQHCLNDEPVQACPPSAWYRLRKFARRNNAALVTVSMAAVALLLTVGSIGWAIRDQAAREAESKLVEKARLETVKGLVRDSYNAARALVAENKLGPARQRLAEAKAQLGNDRSALTDLAAKVEAAVAELDRFQQFLEFIDHAYEAETAPVLEAALAGHGSDSRAGTLPPIRTVERRPAEAVPFLLKALAQYEILTRDDWNTTLAGGLLGRDQVEQVRRTAYEQLLWLADDVLRQGRGEDHRSGRKLSVAAAARLALLYLEKAESAHRATQGLYALRAHCRKALGDEAAAQADMQLTDRTPPTMALDHNYRGRDAYSGRRLAEGVQAFEAALRLEPSHYWSMMRLGYCLVDLGQGPEDFAGAARVFTGCILKRPDHACSYFCRAVAYIKLRRYEEAVADCSKAIQLEPKYAAAWDVRGVVYCDHLGQPAKAVADFSRAIELKPKEAKRWQNRGVAYDKLGRFDKAIADYSKAIELDEKLARTWSVRGFAYFHLGQMNNAVADFSKAIELEPRNAVAWRNRGALYCDHLGQPAEAVADFSRAIELDPNYALAWANRGVAYCNLRKWDKALADCSRGIELDPN
jgi:serine/threonine protein kinase/lipoprotein NlpI